MAVSKRITINNTVKAAVDYIIDKEKTDGLAPNDSEQALTYIADEVKTKQGDLVYGHLCHPDNAADEFELIKKQNMKNVGKEKDDDQGVLAHHFIISFRADDEITPEGALDFGKELVNDMFQYHQSVIAVHTNTDNLHIHIVMNAHTTDPEKQYGKITRMKYNSDKSSYQDLRDNVDRLCLARGLSIEKPELGGQGHTWYENNDRKKGSTLYKNIIKDKIAEAVESSDTWKEYKRVLEVSGVEVNERGNTISYRLKDEDMKRPMRDKRLGENYSKDSIIDQMNNPPERKDVPYYTREGYKDYRVRGISMTGRPKGMVQLVLNLAQKMTKDKGDKALQNSIDHKESEKRLQQLADNQQTRINYDIRTDEDLDNRLSALGKKINNYKADDIRTRELIYNMSDDMVLLTSMKNREAFSIDDETFEEYKEEFMKSTGINTEEKAVEFEMKYQDLEQKSLKISKALREVNRQYGELAKLKEGVHRAKNPEQDRGRGREYER